MKQSAIFILAMLLFVGINSTQNCSAADKYVPEEGSDEIKTKKQRKNKKSKLDPNLPNVLIIGDSISLAYTKMVKKSLKGKVNIMHNPGNSQGTTFSLEHISEWIGDTKWDVIHFNWGLHDLKRVKVAGTSENSDDPNDPYQANIQQYEINIRKLVNILESTGARLVFATTTPFPSNVRPFRDPLDAVKYNDVAIKIMITANIKVNDLYSLVLPQCDTLQRKHNVHFNPKGSQVMADETVKVILVELSLAK